MEEINIITALPGDLERVLRNQARTESQEAEALSKLAGLLEADPKNGHLLSDIFLDFDPKFPAHVQLIQYIARSLLHAAIEFRLNLSHVVFLKLKEILANDPHLKADVAYIDSLLKRDAPYFYTLYRNPKFDSTNSVDLTDQTFKKKRAIERVKKYIRDNNIKNALGPNNVINPKEFIKRDDAPCACLELAACLEEEGNNAGALHYLLNMGRTISCQGVLSVADQLSHIERLCWEGLRDPRPSAYQASYTQLLKSIEDRFAYFTKELPHMSSEFKYLRRRHNGELFDTAGRPLNPAPEIEDIVSELRERMGGKK